MTLDELHGAMRHAAHVKMPLERNRVWFELTSSCAADGAEVGAAVAFVRDGTDFEMRRLSHFIAEVLPVTFFVHVCRW